MLDIFYLEAVVYVSILNEFNDGEMWPKYCYISEHLLMQVVE